MSKDKNEVERRESPVDSRETEFLSFEGHRDTSLCREQTPETVEFDPQDRRIPETGLRKVDLLKGPGLVRRTRR